MHPTAPLIKWYKVSCLDLDTDGANDGTNKKELSLIPKGEELGWLIKGAWHRAPSNYRCKKSEFEEDSAAGEEEGGTQNSAGSGQECSKTRSGNQTLAEFLGEFLFIPFFNEGLNLSLCIYVFACTCVCTIPVTPYGWEGDFIKDQEIERCFRRDRPCLMLVWNN